MLVGFTVFWTSLALLCSFARAAPDGVLPKSKALLEQRAQDLKDESRQKISYRTELVKLEDDIKRSQQCLDQKAGLDTGPLKAAVVPVESAWKTVLASPAKTILDQGNKEYDSLRGAANNLDQAVPSIAECIAFLPMRAFVTRSGDSPRATSSVTDLVARIAGNSLRQVRNSFAPRLQTFLSEYQNERFQRSKLDGSTAQQISQEISGLSRVSEVFTQNIALAKNTVAQLLAGVQSEIKAASIRAEEIDKLLNELDDRLSTGSASLDRQLIIAVYMMIAALLALFLGVRFLPQETANKVIENRSLVEVVSMAFLLLTIIILGTGEKMPKEAIGTLLGSIAGYIFGRKMSER